MSPLKPTPGHRDIITDGTAMPERLEKENESDRGEKMNHGQKERL